MKDKYGIRFFDSNPCCTDSEGTKRTKWVPDPTKGNEPMEFTSPKSALEERDRCQGLSTIWKCPSCSGVFRKSELSYFVQRIPDRGVSLSVIDW